MRNRKQRPPKFGGRSFAKPSKKGKQVNNLENFQSRTISIPVSTGNIHDAFTPLFLMTGHMHDGERIKSLAFGDVKDGVREVMVQITKEDLN